MDLAGLTITEIIQLYSLTIKELKKRHVLRTNNVIGDLGEYLVLDYYNHSVELPNLIQVPVGTENINAVGQDGKRYAIKSTTGNVTGVFYGLEPPESTKANMPIFEYVIICKFDKDCMLEAIYQLDWDTFEKHKRWHSRMKAWNLALTKRVILDSTVVFDTEASKGKPVDSFSNTIETIEENNNKDVIDNECKEPFVWEKAKGINHSEVKQKAALIIARRHSYNLIPQSQSRFESDDKSAAVFIMSASFSEKNQEWRRL